MKIRTFLALTLAFYAAGQVMGEASMQRYASVTMLKPDKVAYYKRLHAHPWPAVTKRLEAMNIHNYSIYLIEADHGQFYLFGYFEYTGSDFSKDSKQFDQDAVCRAWLKETGSCQHIIPLGKEGQIWTAMQEVFHQS